MENKKLSFPAAFWTCSASEIFERLAYYLGRSLILIFVTTAVAEGGLGLSDDMGANMQSNLTAFSYLGSLLGGMVVDSLIGAKYTTPVGMLIAGAGYFVGSISKGPMGVYVMISLVTVGLALFKNGPILGRIITDKEHMDPAFSMRYTLVNVGAFIGTFAVGILYKDVFAKNGVLGFAPCFQLAALSMVLGALWYFFICWKQLGDIGSQPFKKGKTAEEKEFDKKSLTKEGDVRPLSIIEKKRLGAIVLAACISVIFWIFWYLAYLPAYYYWAKNADWVIFGYTIPSTWLDAANSMYCIILGPVMAKIWLVLAARPKGDMSLFKKTGIGIGLLGVCYGAYALLDIVKDRTGHVSVLWIVLGITLSMTLGEMFFSPLGHSFISKYSPSRYLGLMMSVWGLSNFAAAKLYGPVYSWLFGEKTQFGFRTACYIIIAIAVVAALILFVFDKKLSSLVEEK